MLLGEACAANLTNGYQAQQQIESPTNKENYIVALFANGSQTSGTWKLRMPNDWNGGAFNVDVRWSADSAATDSVKWILQARAYDNGDTIDQAFGAAVNVTQANAGQNKLNVTTPLAVTPAGSTTGGCTVLLQISRDAADSLAAVARLWMAALTYTRA